MQCCWNNYYSTSLIYYTGGLTNPRPWRGRCQTGYSNTGGPPLPRKRAPSSKKRAEKIEAEVEAAVMAARVSVSRDEPIMKRLLQYSSNPQKVRIVLSKLLHWAKKKPDIRMQTSLMMSEESRYADILIARGARRKHLAKETEILQTEAARLGR